VTYAQKNLGNSKGSNQLLEGLLAKSEDGGIQARTAQYLYMTGATEDALKRLNAVVEDTAQSSEVRGRALLIKAELFRFPEDDTTVRAKRVALLRELGTRFPATKAGGEGKRKLTAALLTAGDAALPFAVTTAKGERIRQADLKGKAVLLYFWATWSYPSWRNLKQLRQAVAACPAGSVVVIGAACDTYVDRPRTFFAERQIPWHLVAEGNKWRNSLAQLYDVRSLPYYVLVNRYGKLVNHGILRLAQQANVDRFIADLKTAVSE
jgi:peroxiredoxin